VARKPRQQQDHPVLKLKDLLKEVA
jgi:hypothetical protein